MTLQMLFWMGLTVLVYTAMLWVYRRSEGALWAHPLPLAALAMGAWLWLMGTPVAEYRLHTQWLHFLLGPATVALAVPLYQHLRGVCEQGLRLGLPLLVGGGIAPLSALLVLWLFAAPKPLWLPMTVKSITTPLAMAVTESAGGIAGLAAVYVILTGIIGALWAPWVFSWLHIKDPAVRGISLGTIAHAIGTAQAVQEGQRTTAFATLALVINGVLTAVAVPLVLWWVN